MNRPPFHSVVTAEKSGRLGVLVGATRFRDPSSRAERFTLDLLDLDACELEPARIATDFFGHGLAIHPLRPRQAALFEKRGRGGCVLDLTEQRVVAPIAPMPGHAFYGHAAYAPTGQTLFVVETCMATRQGAVSIRDATTMATLGTFPTYGMSPHDCRLVEDGRTLVVTNAGGPIDSPFLPSVAFIDVDSHALLEQHEMGDLNRNAGHVAVTDHRAFAVVSAPRDGLPASTSRGGVSLRQRGGPWIPLSPPEAIASRFVGESLSVAIHTPSRAVLATHPDGGLVTFWSLDSLAFAGSLEVALPRGVTLTLDEKVYAVSYGEDARLLMIEAQTLRVMGDRGFAEGAFGGAHLYAWAR